MLQMALQVMSPPKLALITDSATMFKLLAISHCRALGAGSTAMALEASSRLESTLTGCTHRDLETHTRTPHTLSLSTACVLFHLYFVFMDSPQALA